MSAPLSQAILVAGANEHILKRVHLDGMETTTDLQVFRAPFGTKWHKLGTGHANPELISFSGAIERSTLALARAALDALHADLPNVTTLKLGAWNIPVAGITGAVAITPTTAGHRIQITLIRDGVIT